jgi:hypothetical protein
MSDSFTPVLIEDARISGITDRIKFGVLKGGSQITEAQFKAISATPSNLVWNIQVPSETTIISRQVLLTSTVTLQLTITGVPNGNMCMAYGTSDSLQVFPIQSLFSVVTSTINNTSVSVNLSDILPALMLLNTNDSLMEFNDTTNILPDSFYLQYADAFNNQQIQNNNVLAGASSTDLNPAASPRGCLPIAITAFSYTNSETTPVTTTDFSWANMVSTATTDKWTINVTYTASEPLLFSPWIFGNPTYNAQGFYGIQNLNFQFNVGQTNRVWSSATPYIQNISLVSFQNTSLGFTFISPQPSMLLKSRNVVPYYEMPRYLSNAGTTTTVAPSVYNPSAVNGEGFYVNGIQFSNTTLNTQSIQLNQIPDLLIIMVRKPIGSQTYLDSTSFLCIEGISVNFNNASGLLSNATQMQLYQMSKSNGSAQTWQQFSGFFMQSNIKGGGTGSTGNFIPIPTTGSMLVLQFGKDIPLPDYYAPSSLGNFNLQVRLNCYNQSTTYAADSTDTYGTTGVPGQSITPEICMVTMNSGCFVSDRGTSNIYTGILTKQDVLNTSELQPWTTTEIETLVGGKMNDRIKSALGYGLSKSSSHHQKGKDSSGVGLVGGIGSAVSGGKLSKHLK